MEASPAAIRRRLEASVRVLRRNFGAPPDFAVVLGSGLGEAFLRSQAKARQLSYRQIPHWILPRVDGHQGKVFCLEGRQGRSALVLSGRVHYYEGHSPAEVVFPLRCLARWGLKRVLLTNASGSMQKRLKPGALVLIRDHINLTGANPLRGPNWDFLGTRFPSLNGAYRNAFAKSVASLARRRRVKLDSGVYVGISGPSYETPAEIEAFRRLGGDLIGMSTVFETIAATHAGMEVAALAAVTNSCLAAGEPPNHAEVLRNAKRVDAGLTALLQGLLDERKDRDGR